MKYNIINLPSLLWSPAREVVSVMGKFLIKTVSARSPTLREEDLDMLESPVTTPRHHQGDLCRDLEHSDKSWLATGTFESSKKQKKYFYIVK